jgi:hypothetical protein
MQLRFWLELAAATDCNDECCEKLRIAALKIGVTAEYFDSLREETVRAEAGRRRIISSGAGIAVGIMVLFVFILAATFLKSVIFGLIIAYLLLPVEKFFERRLRRNKGLVSAFFKVTDFIMNPLHRLASALMRKSADDGSGAEKSDGRKESGKYILRAVSATFLLVFVCITLVI